MNTAVPTPVPIHKNTASLYSFSAPYCFSASPAHFPSFLIVISVQYFSFRILAMSKLFICKFFKLVIDVFVGDPGADIPIFSISLILKLFLESKALISS